MEKWVAALPCPIRLCVSWQLQANEQSAVPICVTLPHKRSFVLDAISLCTFYNPVMLLLADY